MLTYSSIKVGKFVASLSRFNITTCIDDIVSQFSDEA